MFLNKLDQIPDEPYQSFRRAILVGEKLFALRESRRGTWRQALGGLAQMHGGSEARRLRYIDLGKFLYLLDGFLRTFNKQIL